MIPDRTHDRIPPPQTLFLRPRFNIVVGRGGIQVEVKAQDNADPATRLLSSMVPGRENAQA
jgi:hypothetical protein